MHTNTIHTHTHTHTVLIVALLHRRNGVVNIYVLVVKGQFIFLETSCRSRAAISAYLRTYETHALKEAEGFCLLLLHLRTYETHALKEAYLPLCCLLTRHCALGRQLFAAPMDGGGTRVRINGRIAESRAQRERGNACEAASTKFQRRKGHGHIDIMCVRKFANLLLS